MKRINENPIIAFDSGIGSLSIIKELRNRLPDENIIYFADRVHFPYGTKTREELFKIMINTIKYLERFSPKLIIIASNTPSVQILNDLKKNTQIPLIGVMPPLKEAVNLTKKNHIGIMATNGTIKSKELQFQIDNEIPQHIFVSKFDASVLIKQIENGVFLKDSDKIFDNIMQITENSKIDEIDVITLSSTHLPLIKSYFKEVFPKIKFVDPAQIIALETKKELSVRNVQRKVKNGTLRILVSKDKKKFQKMLNYFGIRQEPREIFLSF